MRFNILCVGDVFGKPGRKVLEQKLPLLVEREKIDLVIVNGENAAGGKGITPKICKEFYGWGVDVITTGNHARDKKEIDATLLTSERLLRPSNYPVTIPGRGTCLYPCKNQVVGIVNVMGLVHMANLRSPFEQVLEDIEPLKNKTNIVLVDFHAEATSEKRAMGWYLDGKVSAVVGTHTHVQTADEEILPGGTAYISDLGMTGPYHSVIGLKKELALDRFLKNERKKFEVGKGNVKLCGAVISIDSESGKAKSITRIQESLPDL